MDPVINSLLTDVSPFSVVQADSSGKILYANESGRSLLQDLETGLTGFLPGFCIGYISEAVQTRSRKTFEVRTGKRLFACIVVPLPGTETAGLYWRSIKVRQEDEDAGEGTGLYRQMFDTSREGISIMDLERRFVDCNQSFLELLGYECPEDIRGLSSTDLTHPDYHNLDMQMLNEQVLVRGFSDEYEKVMLHKQGRQVPVDTRVWLRLDDSGRPCGMWTMTKDTTERKNAERQIKASEERYRSLVERMIDGVYRSTPDGRFVDINLAMARMFGYESVEEMMSVDIVKALYFSPEEREGPYPESGIDKGSVYRMKKKDGTEIWVEDSAFYVKDENGKVILHEGIVRDVTERVLAGQQQRRAAHQVQTLLEILKEA